MQQMKQHPLENKWTLFSIGLSTWQILFGTLSKLIYFGYDFPDERI